MSLPRPSDLGHRDLRLGGRVALIAGGGGGIGRRVTAALIAAGADVVVAGRSSDTSAVFLENLRAAFPGNAVDFVRADLLAYDECRCLIDAVLGRFGRIDAVANCASSAVAGVGGRFADVDPASFTAFLEASLTSLFNLCHVAAPAIAASGGGSIVTLASDSGRVAAPNQTMVGASRAAIMMFSRSLSLEVAASGVRVNCISTSFVKDTPVYDQVMAGPAASRARTAERRAGLGLPGPDDIAALALFLCSDASRHLTGQVISVNGGVSAA